MGLFDDLFSKPDAAPTMSTVDVAKELQVGADFNVQQLENFKDYAPGFADFIKSTFESLYDPRAKAAEQTQFDIGNQLASKGSTDLLGDFFAYSRQKGLETAAATGAPISGSFTQSLGSNLGAQQLLQNQLQGLGILNNQSQIQSNRAFQFMQPAYSVLQQNMVNPATTLQAGFQNNEIINQNKMIDFANSQRKSWFDTLLSDTAKSAVGMPFSFIQNANNVAASAPNIFAGAFSSMIPMLAGAPPSMGGGGGGGGGGNGVPAALSSGQTSQGMTPTWFSGLG